MDQTPYSKKNGFNELNESFFPLVGWIYFIYIYLKNQIPIFFNKV